MAKAKQKVVHAPKQMLYKAPGPHYLHGIDCDYCIVDVALVEGLLKDGWSLSPAEAEKASKAPKPVEAKADVEDPPKRKRGRPRKIDPKDGY